MGMASRRKGKSGERELAGVLMDLLGVDIRRNLDQTRDGGYDLLGVPGWAIECKRYASAQPCEIATWWAQSVRQAEAAGLRPVLFYRLDRQDWQALVDASDVHPAIWPQRDTHVLNMRLESWAQLARETWATGVAA